MCEESYEATCIHILTALVSMTKINLGIRLTMYFQDRCFLLIGYAGTLTISRGQQSLIYYCLSHTRFGSN